MDLSHLKRANFWDDSRSCVKPCDPDLNAPLITLAVLQGFFSSARGTNNIIRSNKRGVLANHGAVGESDNKAPPIAALGVSSLGENAGRFDAALKPCLPLHCHLHLPNFQDGPAGSNPGPA